MSSNLKLAFVIEAIDNATRKVRAVNDAVAKSREPYLKLRAAARDLFQEAGWDKLQTRMQAMRERGANLMGTLRGVAVGFGAATAAAGGVFFALKRNIDLVDGAQDMAKKLGVTVEVIQRMGYAAKLNGSSEEEMGQALQFLSKQMVEAITGGKEAALWFARVGIPLERLKKMNVAQVWETIGDKFQQVGDKGQNAEKKIALLSALTGRSSTGLVQMANLGAAGMRKFYEEADRLGAVVDGHTAEAMADFNDNFDRLQFSIRGVVAVIAKYALPQLDAMVRKFTDMNVASRQALGEQLGRMVGDLITRLPAFLSSLGQIAGTLANMAVAADRVAQAMGGWQNVMTVIAAVIGAKLLFQFVAFVAAVATALPTILGVAKVVWWLAAGLLSVVGLPALIGAGLVGAAVAIWAYWEPIGKFFTGLWQTIKSVAGAAWGWKGIGVGSGGAPGAVPSAVPSAIARGGAQQLGNGTLRIYFDERGRGRVSELKKDPAGLIDYDVYSGPMMVTP